MVALPVEYGDSFEKVGSVQAVWTVNRFIENSKPVHVELMKRNDRTTRITVSIEALSNPRLFRRLDSDSR